MQSTFLDRLELVMWSGSVPVSTRRISTKGTVCRPCGSSRVCVFIVPLCLPHGWLLPERWLRAYYVPATLLGTQGRGVGYKDGTFISALCISGKLS